MEGNKVIFSSKLSGYRPIIWLGEAVYRRDNQIRAILKDRLGEEYAELFTDMSMSSESIPDKATANWVSSWVKTATPLSRFNESQQQALKEKLRLMINRIGDLCMEMKNSGNKEHIDLSEVILLATNIPSEDCIMSDGQKIVLVFWGFLSDLPGQSGVELMKFLGYDFDEAHLSKKQEPLPPLEKKETVQEVKKDAPPVTEKQEPIVVQNSQIQSPTPPPPPNKKRRCKWWCWLLIVLGILLILALLFFLLRGCTRNGLPEQGVVPPIDTTQIIKNPGDTLQRPVLGNRLNVILDKNANINKFAKDFDDQFGSDAHIVYIDSTIMQLQIEFSKGDIPEWKTKIKALPDVRIVFEESIFHSQFTPSDPAFTHRNEVYHFDAIKAFGGWNTTKGKSSVVIAVIDDGFDLTHPEFQGHVSEQWNVPENAAHVHTNGGRCFHGTHVAALAIGNMNNQAGACGVAPECMLMPIQISDPNGNISTTYIINGVLYAIKHGADVINLSLGMQWPAFVKDLSGSEQEELARTLYPEEAGFWNEMFAYANDYGVVVVQAAGNDGVLASIDPMKRSDNSIVVAATNSADERSSFSNFGERCDVSAPGTQVFSAIPNGRYTTMDGTSMASPIVAGAAGLLLSVNDQLKNADVKKILIETGIRVGTQPNKPVGPLIQLDSALKVAATFTPQDCCDMVDSLLNVINRLKQNCDDDADKMKMPDQALDCSFTKGRWVSSDNLVNSTTQVPVQLFFNFDGQCNGTLTFSEKNGNRCSVGVVCKIQNRKMTIEQLEFAPCSDGTEYTKHTFICIPDKNGILQCTAHRTGSSAVLVKFTMNRL